MSDIRKGIYVLPNLFTTASLLCGFYAIVTAIERLAHGGNEGFDSCAMAIILAACFDGLDGRVARKTRTATRFGVEYDSLSDLVSFGVAPAVTMYCWTLRDMGRVGWLACFLYMACGALRLARFNVQVGTVEKKYFQGLPIPMAALMVSTAILIWEGRALESAELYLLFMTYLLAGLMVSTIPYRSFKSFDLTAKKPFYTLVFVLIGLMIWAIKPWWVLFISGWGYLLSGPVERYVLPPPVRLYRRARRRRRIRDSLERMDRIASEGSNESAAPEHNVHPLRRL